MPKKAIGRMLSNPVRRRALTTVLQKDPEQMQSCSEAAELPLDGKEVWLMIVFAEQMPRRKS